MMNMTSNTSTIRIDKSKNDPTSSMSYGLMVDDDNNNNNLIQGQPNATTSTTTTTTTTWGITNYNTITDLEHRTNSHGNSNNTKSNASSNNTRLRSKDDSIYVTDEVFNTASHLVACMVSILGTVLLISQASSQLTMTNTTTNDSDPSRTKTMIIYKIISFSIYGISLITLFACSTLHHGITISTTTTTTTTPASTSTTTTTGTVQNSHAIHASTKNVWEERFRRADYIAIYPLIAGTVTPLGLVYYHHTVIGWTYVMTIWTIAILSMIFTSYHFQKIPKWFSMTLYMTLGSMGALMSFWLYEALHMSGFALFVLGALFYTVGGYIFVMEPPGLNLIPNQFGFHEIWHIAVILGALSHFMVMYLYVLPY
jgi:hemolysin III